MAILLAVLIFLTACAERGGEKIADIPQEIPSQTETGDQPPEGEAAQPGMPELALGLAQFAPVGPDDLIAVIETQMGTIRIRLFPEHAPLAVENFVGLAGEGFYNGSNFHRVINGFMIQTGAANRDGSGATSIFRDEDGNPVPFADEFTVTLWHFRGALSMANPGTRDSNMSQFFIVQDSTADLSQMQASQYPEDVIERYLEVGGAQHLDWAHTVFGHVIEGMDVVDAIAGVETTGRPLDRPLEDVLILSVRIEQGE